MFAPDNQVEFFINKGFYQLDSMKVKWKVSTLNSEFYENDIERWNEIDKVKKKVAKHLRVPERSRVLDVLVGEGDFARAIAKSS